MKSLFFKLFGGPMVHGHRTISPLKLGVVVVVGTIVLTVGTLFRSQIITLLTPNDTIKVNFAQNQVLLPYYHQAKINWVPIGKVTAVEQLDDGTAMVTLQVNSDSREKLGTAPSAVLRPTTLLGGNYFIDLQPGGDPGEFTDEVIPLDRTRMPVELDEVARTFQPRAQVGLRGFVEKFDATLSGGGREALQRLLEDAPEALRPTAEVLDAARGTNPNTDLTNIVSGLESTARALTAREGQLDSIVANLAITSATFGQRAPEFASTLEQLPGTMKSAQAGLQRLNVTLDVLEDVAGDVRPTAQQLDDTLDRVTPVLEDARPLVNDLRDVVEDARPLVEDLVPTTQDLTDVLDDLRGPVLDRVNGPISDLLLNPYQGERGGRYEQTFTEKPIYQEVFYALANFDRAVMMDRKGSSIAYGPTPSPELLEGLIANDGPPRTEGLLRTFADPNRQNPPIKPGPEPLQEPGDDGQVPMLGDFAPGENFAPGEGE